MVRRRLARVQVAEAYLEVAMRNPLVEACLGVRRRPRRIRTICSWVASNSHPIYSSTNPNPLLGGRNFLGGTLGTSTFSGGQQPQHQQLTAGSLLSSRSAGGWDSGWMILRASMLVLLLGLKGYIMRGTPLLLSVSFRYPFCSLFYFRY